MNELATEYARRESGAIFSPCGRYRYALWRRFPTGAATQADMFPTDRHLRRDAQGSIFAAPARPQVVVGVNPSVADGEDEDPTSFRCVKRARSHGAGGVIIVNPYALVTKDPRGLLLVDPDEPARGFVEDPVGPRCDEFIFDAIQMAREVIVAWGSTIEGFAKVKRNAARPAVKLWRSRVAAVEMAAFNNDQTLLCLGTTQSGAPLHPLYLPDGARLRAWTPRT